MADQISSIQGPGGVQALEDKVLGPTYDYSGHIKAPDEMGMSSEGNFDALGNDIGGLLGYIDLLVSGDCGTGSCASKYPSGATFGKPLGNKFFLDTAVDCEDKATGNKVTRSIYINNVPDGQIPFISNMGGGVGFSEFRGLMPGIMSNIAQIHPMQILMAFVNGASPTCQAITMPTIDAVTNEQSTATRYVINTDISLMPDSWFTDGVPAKSTYDLKNDISGNAPEQFTGKVDAYSPKLQASRVDYSKMPNDVVIKFYYSVLGLLGLYILLRLMMGKKRWFF